MPDSREKSGINRESIRRVRELLQGKSSWRKVLSKRRATDLSHSIRITMRWMMLSVSGEVVLVSARFAKKVSRCIGYR